jgi:hypothetical protein
LANVPVRQAGQLVHALGEDWYADADQIRDAVIHWPRVQRDLYPIQSESRHLSRKPKNGS